MYVDDIVIIGNDMACISSRKSLLIKKKNISSRKSFLHGQFHTKDLRMLKYFLGVEVVRSKRIIFLSQRKYVLDLLSKTGKLAAKPCPFLMAQSLHLTREGELFGNLER